MRFHPLAVILSYRPKALQGAFVEHQTMLQKSSLQAEITVNLVRSVQDLQTCDALVIPGGGMSPNLALTLIHVQSLSRRIDNDCSPGQARWSPRPTPGVLKDQTRLGLMRWCDPHVSQCHECKGGWSRPSRWSFRQHRQKRMGISGGMTGSGSLHCRHSQRSIQAESFEAPLVVQSLPQPDRPFQGVFIRAPVLPHLCSLNPQTNILLQVVLSVEPTPEDPPLQILARIPVELLPDAQHLDQYLTDPLNPRTIVAFRQGNHLFTSFHPELTKDNRFHAYFVQECVLPSLATRHLSATD